MVPPEAAEDDRAWHYRGLTERQFNALAGRRTVPAFLALVTVPAEARDYAHADPARLRLARAAYWLSLANRQKIPSPSDQRRVTVLVPRANLRTVETLTALCGAAPGLSPKTWYGMPAYASAEGKVVVAFENSGKFGTRYSIPEFQDAAHLDDGDVWPVSFALRVWTQFTGL